MRGIHCQARAAIKAEEFAPAVQVPEHLDIRQLFRPAIEAFRRSDAFEVLINVAGQVHGDKGATSLRSGFFVIYGHVPAELIVGLEVWSV